MPLDAPDLPGRLEGMARRHETSCGQGGMVWHEWGPPEAPPLLLLHGGAGSWRHWIRNIEALARHRRVLAPDMPGLGESAQPPAGIDLWGYVGLIESGFAQLALESRAARYDLVGFSFGGILAGHMASRADARLRSVTLLGAGGLGLARVPTRLASVRNKQGEERAAAHRANLAMLMIADPARIDALALRIQAWNSDHARLRSRNLVLDGALRDVLPKIHAPLAMAYGERDAIAYPFMDQRRTLLAALRPEAGFHVIPRAGHWVQFEAAEAVNALLLRRLEGAAPAA
ncbi:alpha/beta fold hydrolase [Roseomonas marmotae]|uniref:Alpha/beta fold hydrolase n=2 Tax=Roseomonas marmotae TaxID=2768161 RepID=A0ABS3KBY4_9PROT|nr:alpha/beta fold hydrolase [Roseomonas marmotae]MBO1074977.1 alpha/beta fold hydrolase [Roseomonas marmotae]